MTKRTFFLF